MLLALVLSFDHRKGKVSVSPLDIQSSKGHKYIWYALSGYAIGLITALSAGVLTHSPQPALLYLVYHLLPFINDHKYILCPQCSPPPLSCTFLLVDTGGNSQ